MFPDMCDCEICKESSSPLYIVNRKTFYDLLRRDQLVPRYYTEYEWIYRSGQIESVEKEVAAYYHFDKLIICRD